MKIVISFSTNQRRHEVLKQLSPSGPPPSPGSTWTTSPPPWPTRAAPSSRASSGWSGTTEGSPSSSPETKNGETTRSQFFFGEGPKGSLYWSLSHRRTSHAQNLVSRALLNVDENKCHSKSQTFFLTTFTWEGQSKTEMSSFLLNTRLDTWSFPHDGFVANNNSLGKDVLEKYLILSLIPILFFRSLNVRVQDS